MTQPHPPLQSAPTLCTFCHSPNLDSAARTKYCSQRCQRRAQRRAQRQYHRRNKKTDKLATTAAATSATATGDAPLEACTKPEPLAHEAAKAVELQGKAEAEKGKNKVSKRRRRASRKGVNRGDGDDGDEDGMGDFQDRLLGEAVEEYAEGMFWDEGYGLERFTPGLSMRI